MNLRRAPGYALRTGGRSLVLSAALVGAELMAVPVGLLLDTRARLRGPEAVALVHGAFEPMDRIAQTTEPPRYTGTMSWRELLDVRAELVAWGREARSAPPERVAEGARALLARLEAHEEAARAHLAMARHLVESLGRAAVGEGPADLVRATIDAQLPSLPLAHAYDYLAQRLHRRGVGVLVNDVPPIPFA